MEPRLLNRVRQGQLIGRRGSSDSGSCFLLQGGWPWSSRGPSCAPETC